MVRVIVKRPDGEVIDERINGTIKDSNIFDDTANGGVVIRFEDCTYITHFSNVCLIETPDD